MNTKRIVLSAIIAALPFTANAENISGAMYTAPIAPTQQAPAPTASVSAPYGRINIDTDDQEHIATTAYVKGAYNSAIAAVNKVDSDKQNQLYNMGYGGEMSTDVMDSQHFADEVQAMLDGDLGAGSQNWNVLDSQLISAASVIEGLSVLQNVMSDDVGGQIDSVYDEINVMSDELDNKRVAIYTTWGDDSAKAPVALANINDFN